MKQATCQSCGKVYELSLSKWLNKEQCSDCWNGRTPDVASSNALPAQPGIAPSVEPPFATWVCTVVQVFAWVFSIAMLISGVIILTNMPEPYGLNPVSSSDFVVARARETARTIALTWGFGEIIGAVFTFAFLTLVAGMGRVLLEMWTAQFSSAKPNNGANQLGVETTGLISNETK